MLRSPTSVAIYLKTRRAAETGVQVKTRRSNARIDTSALAPNNDLSRLRYSVNIKANAVGSIVQNALYLSGLLGHKSFEPYDLATHSVRIRKSGTIADVNSLWDIERNFAV